MTKVPIDSVKTNRTLMPGDGELVQELAADIKKHGLRRPLILRENMTIIDGLKRLEALKLLGAANVPVVISDDFYTVLDLIKEVHGKEAKDRIPLSERRAYELHSVLAELSRARGRKLRKEGKWRLEDRPKDDRRADFREAVAEALNLPYGAYMSRIVRVYRQANVGDPVAQDLMAKVDAGEITSQTAFHILQSTRDNGDVTDPDEQRRILNNSIRNIAVMVKGLKSLKRPVNLPPEELAIFVQQLGIHRGALANIARQLSKEIKSLNG